MVTGALPEAACPGREDSGGCCRCCGLGKGGGGREEVGRSGCSQGDGRYGQVAASLTASKAGDAMGTSDEEAAREGKEEEATEEAPAEEAVGGWGTCRRAGRRRG